MKPAFSQLIIFCRDVNTLACFYTQKLGLEVVGQIHPEWTVLKAGDVEIGLHKIDNADHTDRPSAKNMKMVFRLSGDISQIRQKLIDQGVKMREVKDFSSVPYFICDGEDPEGNVFQLTVINT
ncbi:VOC family protein [Mucilaginibacter ximonensis]|uniref:VOC family protein n=1 Tax=Mucilaginibacter ximonensis TaxID=538021 RepID=A0ABW5YHM4_9SPHI